MKMAKTLSAAVCVLLLLSFILLPAAQAHEDEPHHPTSLAELEEGLREVMWESKVPGLSVAVVEQGQVVWTAGLGVIDQESGRQAEAGSVFRVGSISKSFVSLAVMKLVEEGRLSLDDRLADLAPEVEFSNPWEAEHPVRLVHLLEHTSGFDDLHMREYAYQDPDISLAEALAYNPGSRTSRWQPGLFFSYSNSGPAAAAYVVEKISGQRFEDYVRENFFEPLGMENTSYFLTPEMEARLSKSYSVTGREVPYSHIIMRPSGSVSTTPADMGNLLIFLIERGSFDGQSLLSAETIERIETPQASLGAQQGLTTGYAKGNFTSIYESFIFHGHDGGIDGFVASYGYLPEQRSGYYVSQNGGPAASPAVVELIRSYLTRELEPPPALPQPALPPESAAFQGYYTLFTSRIQMLAFVERLAGVVRISAAENGLDLRPLLGGEAQRVLPVSGTLYRAPGEPQATAAFAEHPEYGRVLVSMTGNVRMIPAWQAVGGTLLSVITALLLLSVLLYALVWVPLWLFRPARRRPHTSLLGLPLLAVLALLATLAFLVIGYISGLEALGTPSLWSVGLFGLSLLFGLLALAAVIQAVRLLGRPEVSRWVRIYSLVVSLALLLAALYLTLNGFVGMRTWV